MNSSLSLRVQPIELILDLLGGALLPDLDEQSLDPIHLGFVRANPSRSLVLVLLPSSFLPSLPRPLQPSLALLGLPASSLFFFQLFRVGPVSRFVTVVEARTQTSRPMQTLVVLEACVEINQ
jgi:hypothetical protein